MTNAARDSALRTAKSMAECLCDEIVACAAEDKDGSKCMNKKVEIEKNAKGNRWFYDFLKVCIFKLNKIK